jgi:hypothetical protein
MKRITFTFSRLNLAQFINLLHKVVTNMTDNPNFPTLQTQVNAFTTQVDTYITLAAKAEKRDQDAIIARDVQRRVMNSMLHDLGVEITAIAKGSEAILSSSGLPFSKTREVTPPMVQPATPVVSPAVNKGGINAKTKAQPGIKSANFYIAPLSAGLNADGSRPWQVYSHNKVKYTYTGLISGEAYIIQIGLVGVRGQEVISDPVTYIAQ